MVIRPAVSGVENVLRAVDEAPSVERVVMTSSVGAVVGHHWERGRDHVYTEADWNQTATETFLPYHRCVTASADPHHGGSPITQDCELSAFWPLVLQ